MEDHLDTASVLEELRALEPIFHTQAFGTTMDDFAHRMVDDYWEIGASGARYDRAFILKHLASTPPVDAEAAGWITSHHQVRRLAADTFLLTYQLQQLERVTWRSTVWRRSEQGWQVVFHQGTVISS
ncbi:DUF4440 domain-containing protein [Terriglobus roseus]|uniref:Uncharacterized protein n=1 Tax=Terriglobus roseus TaxID=392734 RepID=A0A1G7P047_9BACT|nr:DUF4440 domain-containing protein [Terriglobus roseus]SDF79487.1 hypothetical protein SAMN05444167_3336 [Terriglobus roseus]